jgi:Domain of unknown function (DUF4331)
MSDHFSGPRALAGPQCDICDFYAFPSPEQPGNLILVMDVLPFATASSSFSDAIICRLRVRPASVASTGPNATFALGKEEAVFDFRFNPPGSQAGSGPLIQECTCTLPTGEKIRFMTNDEKGAWGGGCHAFAGLRLDPFFLDGPALQETAKAGRLAFKETGGTNLVLDANVLSIVLAIDAAMLPPSAGKLFSAACETVADGKLEIRLERLGRPEIKNVLLFMKQYDKVNRDLELRDIYNLEDAFHVGPDYRGAYRARLNANLAFWDQLDGVTHWPLSTEGAHPLTELLLADFLVVDTTKALSDSSYFEIEQAILEGRAHETCGGRSLNEDVMDTLYTIYANGGKGPRISDGVDQATARASQTFPYLAPPNLKPSQPKSAFLASQDAAKAKPSDHQQSASGNRQHDPGDHHHYKFGRFQL